MFLEGNGIITESQNGFRAKRGTQDTVMKLSRDIFKSLNDNKYVGAVFIDYRKAFDTINHRKLLDKLPKFGFSDTVVNWFENYLGNRAQKTIANSVHSNWSDVNYGVPQGSILGPLLFILYVNDISNMNMNSKLLQYADDTVLYFFESDNIKTITENLQKDLNSLVNYCDKNQLTINATKTKSMLYTYNDNVVLGDLKVKGKVLEEVKSYKYLGITLDSSLTFKNELGMAIKKINHKIWMLSHFRNCMDVKTAVNILKTMILPYIDSSNLFFSALSIIDQKRIQILQNIALRVCFRILDPTEISVKKLHEMAKIFPIDLRRKYLQGVICYRLISTDSLVLEDYGRTRAADGPLIRLYISHSERNRKSPPNSAFSEWNSIPSCIRLSENKESFKRALKAIVLKFFVKKWRYDLQFTAGFVENIYTNIDN